MTHELSTEFGPVQVKVHPCDEGWLLVVVGQHSLPYVPSIDACTADSEAAALEQVADAIQRLASY